MQVGAYADEKIDLGQTISILANVGVARESFFRASSFARTNSRLWLVNKMEND